MPRFVIQEHHLNNQIHFDLMLEHGEILKTWQFNQSPDLQPQSIRLIQDHRKLYLDYEGEIPANRGHVRIWDQGEYSISNWGLDRFDVQFQGNIIKGNYLLRESSDSIWNWELKLTG